MKKLVSLLIFAGITLASISAGAQDRTSWIRKSAISPDGQTIAFSYQGDIFTVGIGGGQARQITSNPAYDSEPMWTSDSKNIVFVSYRELSKDIWIVPAVGGTPLRLTNYNGNETPLAVLPEGKVLFSASIQADASYGDFPGSAQIYSVSTKGGKISRVTSLPMAAISVNAEGIQIYEDNKGYEDPLRKHHTSSVTRDIWMHNPKTGEYTKLSTFEGEDRNPVFAANGNDFYFLCERGGNLNVWKSSISNPQDQKQITSLPVHPVRGLSVAADGRMLFSYNGDLYTCTEGTEPQRLEITITKDQSRRPKELKSIAGGVRSIAVSPNGEEIAVVTKGDVYITAIDHSSTRRITATAAQERGVSFGDEGRSIYYASERDGEWAIWKTELADKDDKYFSFAYDFKEERVTAKGQTCFQPEVSPDGKWLAYLRDRTDIVIKNTKTGKEKVLLEGINYSYSDGDQEFSWCNDSHHILCTYMINGGWNNTDIAMIDIETGQITNLTESGYSDGGFNWALGGKAMTWTSDKNGYRSHGSWGAEDDVYIMFFDQKAYREFMLDKATESEEKFLSKGDKKAEKEEKKEQKDSLATEKGKKLDLNLKGLEDRTVRLTSMSGRVGGHVLTRDGKKLYYSVQTPEGRAFYCLDLKSGDLKKVKSVSGGFVISPDGKYIYSVSLFGVTRFDLDTQASKTITFSGEYEYDSAAERAYIFEHAWKQVNDKFYDASIHGVDWKSFHDNYAQFLPYIDNNFDFQDLLSEMLGELNASHTGARYYYRGGLNVGFLGLIYDETHEGAGLKIKEILPGSVLALQDIDLKEGDVITSIDGKKIAAGTPWWQALSMKANKKIVVEIGSGSKARSVKVKAATSDAAGLYKRWVRQREEMVAKLSGGRVGYVHIEGMDSPSFRELYSKALGKYRGCEALIVDTRHNGGGWLHDDLVTFLSGQTYVEFRPRGQYIGHEPFRKWTKPSCVLMGEDNYSDASGFPYAYKALGLGKLIGAPVPGTMTAVWWETQVDATLVFGIPQVTNFGVAEGRALENFQLEPDILIYNDPASVLRGEDKQLEAAVKEMLKQIDNK